MRRKNSKKNFLIIYDKIFVKNLKKFFIIKKSINSLIFKKYKLFFKKNILPNYFCYNFLIKNYNKNNNYFFLKNFKKFNKSNFFLVNGKFKDQFLYNYNFLKNIFNKKTKIFFKKEYNIINDNLIKKNQNDVIIFKNYNQLHFFDYVNNFIYNTNYNIIMFNFLEMYKILVILNIYNIR